MPIVRPLSVVATAAFAAALTVTASERPASAHMGSATYGRLTPTADPARVHYQLLLNGIDLHEPLGITDTGHTITAGDITAGKPRLLSYLGQRVHFEGDGAPCRLQPQSVEAVDESQLFARVEYEVVCPAAIRQLALEYDLFFDLDARHIGYVAVGGTTARLTAPDNTRLVWQVGHALPGGFFDFVRAGIHHILSGIDHLMFLISLLLMAVVARGVGPGQSDVRIRPVREALSYTGAIVTSFTIAHSMTLIGAALGWFELPSRLVESAIAASIAFVAIDNAIRLDPPRRYLVTFGFGLVHGMGFASMLRPLLPPRDVVVPLLTFNAGVEIGQLGVVLLCMPLLYGLARTLGPRAYRRAVLPIGAVVLGGFGLIWFFERLLGITILGIKV